MGFQLNELLKMAVTRSLPCPDTRPAIPCILILSLDQRSCVKSKSVAPPANVWKQARDVSGDTIYLKIRTPNILYSLALWWNGRSYIWGHLKAELEEQLDLLDDLDLWFADVALDCDLPLVGRYCIIVCLTLLSVVILATRKFFQKIDSYQNEPESRSRIYLFRVGWYEPDPVEDSTWIRIFPTKLDPQLKKIHELPLEQLRRQPG